MRLWQGLIIMGTAAWLAGCATQEARFPIHPPPPQPRNEPLPPPPPPPSEPTPATLVGRIVSPTGRGAERWSCEGQSVVLLAADPATATRMEGLYGSNVSAAAPVETVRRRAAAVGAAAPAEPPIASATCADASGFTFSGLRPGAYFLVARAKLSASGGAANYALMRRVTLRPGETAVIALPEARAPARRSQPRPPSPQG